MSQPFLGLRRCFCAPHPDSTPCVPSTVNCHLSWPGSRLPCLVWASLHLHPRDPALCVWGLPSPCIVCLPVCLPVSLSLCLCLSFSLSVLLSLLLSLTFRLSVSLGLIISVCLSLCLRACLCLSASLSVSSNRVSLCFPNVLLQNHKISSH